MTLVSGNMTSGVMTFGRLDCKPCVHAPTASQAISLGIKVPLANFDRNTEHVVQTYASMIGLGIVLLQEGRPVIYISRTQSPAEERYSYNEKELLGVVLAMERLPHCVYGEPVRVQTDHKPREMIWKKSISTASPRLRRLLLRLARYDIQVEYICGKDNSVADA